MKHNDIVPDSGVGVHCTAVGVNVNDLIIKLGQLPGEYLR